MGLSGAELGTLLDTVENTSPVAGVAAFADELARGIGAQEVAFLIADISGGSLIRIVSVGQGSTQGEAARKIPIEDTPEGHTLRTQEPQVTSSDAGAWVHVPVSQRGNAMGVLELCLPHEPDEEMLTYLAAVAHLLAYVIIADQRFTDAYEWGARTSDLTIAAEVQRQLLPLAYTCEAGQFSLAGWLVPASEAGGDTFDYALGEESLHLSMTDAMGHGLAAAQLATLAVGSLRNSRRRGSDVLTQMRCANQTLVENTEDDQFVTGLLMRVELATGLVQLVNAGHIAPFLVREGVLTTLTLQTDIVLGVIDDPEFHIQEFQLCPADRLVLVTDGMLEREAEIADLPRLLREGGDLHPRELAQNLTQAVFNASEGVLADDATVLVLDWYGDTHPRETSGGTATGHASS